MFTEKLYYNNSYITDFRATVISCEKSGDLYKIVLDKTAFFPESGGQKADCGYIGDSFVSYAFEEDNVVYHIANKSVDVSSSYDCRINWKLRFNRMQQHSGEHVVSGIVHSLFGYDNVGFHMEDDYVTVDFSGELTRKKLDLVEDKANEAIYKNYAINCFFPDEDKLNEYDYRSKLELTENVRLVEIENTDLCACCAPHLNSTGEIGIIKILDFMRHRGGVRIIIKSGFDALSDYRQKYKSVYEISGLLSAKQEEISSSVERIINELDSVKREFYAFRQSVACNSRDNLTFVNDVAFLITDGFDADMMREVCNFGADKSKLCIVYSGDDENGYSYIACSRSGDMKAFAQSHNKALNGRGGGRDTMIQGKITAKKEKIIEYITNFDAGELNI